MLCLVQKPWIKGVLKLYKAERLLFGFFAAVQLFVPSSGRLRNAVLAPKDVVLPELRGHWPSSSHSNCFCRRFAFQTRS